MLRRSPLKAKRATPRRNLGRVQHGKTKDGGARPPTKEERRHMDRVASQGCLVCGGPATIHHVTSDGYKRIARSHKRVTPLCSLHHLIQHGPKESVEALGHAGFKRRYGVDLLVVADDLWEKRNA